MTCKSSVDIDAAIYKGVWTLPSSYFGKCKRIFLVDMSVDEFSSRTTLADHKELLVWSKEFWEVSYYNLHGAEIEKLPSSKRLLISFRQRLYLPSTAELKVALVTLKDNSHG